MRVLGLISGTSLDGIDVAAADLTLDRDELRARLLGWRTVPYSEGLAGALRASLPPFRIDAGAVCRLDTLVGQEFAAAAAGMVDQVCEGTAELVVSHGQTLFHWVDHSGRARGTLQVGQPAWIAEATGIPVLSDLRSRDVAAGGQGAPLVSLFDVLLLGGGPDTRVALNLGGIANLTVVTAGREPLAYDAGPGNALLDAAADLVSGGSERCDSGGARALRGRTDRRLLHELLVDPYYRRRPPKSTGKERFNSAYLEAALARAPVADADDLLATLTTHAAAVVADECERRGARVVVASGGGTENPALMGELARRLRTARLESIEAWGIPSGAKEAYAFAVLGFLGFHGVPGTLPSCTGARRASLLGSLTPGVAPLRMPTLRRSPRRLRVDAPDPSL